MFKSNISPLIAEQYRITKLFVKVLPSGERVLVDPSLTVSRVYMVSILSTFAILSQAPCHSTSTSLSISAPLLDKSP